jgi:Uma2 family endonuclease
MSAGIAVPLAYRLTISDWLESPEDRRCELIEGELHVVPPPAIRHQRVSRRLLGPLQAHVELNRLGEVFYSPTGVRFSDETAVEPDLTLVLAAHADRVREQWVEAPPDLVVEILSPGTARRDLVLKRELYQSSSVPEYWVVDPEAQTVEVLTLRAGRYERFGLFGRADRLRSALLPGLEIPLAEVFNP